MKSIKIQLENAKGEVVEESTVTIGDKDTLIMQFPEEMTIEKATRCYKMLKAGLEDNQDLIGLPQEITFKVIKSV